MARETVAVETFARRAISRISIGDFETEARLKTTSSYHSAPLDLAAARVVANVCSILLPGRHSPLARAVAQLSKPRLEVQITPISPPVFRLSILPTSNQSGGEIP